MLTEASINFITRAIDELEKRRKDHLESASNDVQKFLTDHVLANSHFKNISVQPRVKTSGSLREKIIRKKSFIETNDEVVYIDKLDDIIGVRLVCLLNKEETLSFQYIDEEKFTASDESYSIIPGSDESKPYLRINKNNQPDIQKNGKGIYKMKCQWVTNERIINVELQIKSLAHTFWGEIEHMLFYKNYAYTVGAGFYKEIMNSVGEMLQSVDYQLEVLRDHLSVHDDLQQIQEIKQMVTRIMYSVYQPEVTKMVGCEIDLRQVYELVVELVFFGIVEKDVALSKTSDILNVLNSGAGKLIESTFDFGNYEVHKDRTSDRFLTKSASDLAKGPDIFWKSLFAIYKIIQRENDFTKLSTDIITKLFSFYDSYHAEFLDMDNKGVQLFAAGITQGLKSYYYAYKKIDYFSPYVYQKEILEEVIQSIARHQYSFEGIDKLEIDEGKSEEVIKLISYYLKLKIDLIINKNISNDDLSKLDIWSKKEGLLWFPNLNMDEVKKTLKNESSITKEQFDEFYELVGEEE